MKVYVGQTRAKKLIAYLEALGFGECTQPTEVPPRRSPWFLDNGAFGAWKAGAPFDDVAFLRALECDLSPEWVVCPDIVAGGHSSLEFSEEWRPRLGGQPAYLAVQDGMVTGDVAGVASSYAGLFVGGTVDWKLETGAAWVELAHSLGIPCHVGRVGTAKRVRWAFDIGADSIDSCLPLWSRGKLDTFVRALEDCRRQATFWGSL